jgi:hypothetical protein
MNQDFLEKVKEALKKKIKVYGIFIAIANRILFYNDPEGDMMVIIKNTADEIFPGCVKSIIEIVGVENDRILLSIETTKDHFELRFSIDVKEVILVYL